MQPMTLYEIFVGNVTVRCGKMRQRCAFVAKEGEGEVDLLLQRLLQVGTQLPPEFVSLLALIVALLSLKLFQSFGGLAGLNLYNGLVICLANIQVLQITKYTFFKDQLPLGTVLFATIYLSNICIAETYGAKAGRQSVWLGMGAYAFFALSMLLSLAHLPAEGDAAFLCEARQNHAAMLRIFVPSVRIFVASLASFGISQFTNLFLFQFLQKDSLTKNSKLTSLATILASNVVDNVVFCFVAFYFLAEVPIPPRVLWSGYVWESLGVRALTVGCVLGGKFLLEKIFRWRE